MTTTRLLLRAGASAALITLAAAAPRALAAQSLEGSKWSIDQEGVDTPVLWWLGSQGRVRTGDIGTILPGYRWVQKEDSIIVSVGDTLRYAGVLMANRLVGVRTGPRRQEGWWSGARADGPTAVAQAPAAPAAPVTNPGTEQMNRPVDQPVSVPPATTPSTTPSNPQGQPRAIRRIERADGGNQPAAPAQPAGEGREIRRLPRPGARNADGAAELPATVVIPSERFVGRWVRSDTGGVIESFEALANGDFVLGLTTGAKGTGTWANGNSGTQATLAGNEGGSAVIRFWEENGEVHAIIVTAVGARRTWRFHRAGGGGGAATASGSTLEPAVPVGSARP